MSYVGRFAPSPTGPLHLGSLVTAAAGFIHARQNAGQWLLRIEDIDPPREVPGAADGFLQTLDTLGLHWDGPVDYQSRRLPAYRQQGLDLLTSRAAFRCRCSRKDLRDEPDPAGLGKRYPGTCRNRNLTADDSAIRLRVDAATISFIDGICGQVSVEISEAVGDYMIVRRDGLPAYHLAAAMDDGAEEIDTVVRGADLLLSSCIHLHLMQILRLQAPRYFHVPIVTDRQGEKLSKRHGAPAVDGRNASEVAARILGMLGLQTPRDLAGATPATLWEWAIGAWNIRALSGIETIPSDVEH